MTVLKPCGTAFACLFLSAQISLAQLYDEPDRGQPGDSMIQAYLARRAQEIHSKFLQGIERAEDWSAVRPRYVKEYFYMLGLQPLPPKTPLRPKVTGTLRGDGFVVEKLHFQSMPGLYVTANLYRPPERTAGVKYPAILYVCGHSYCGRNGNKTAYQSHGIWYARHGYVCLVLDTLQLGEIAGIHHGTYRYGRWWWHSRGYTPAGVECWNGIRGVDYLQSRPDVDPDRIGVTGISGGGAATFWIAAADGRLRAAAPVSGMADLPSYVTNRVINGHCDCMFLYNTFRWPWTRIAALIAPRPLLFVNSHRDRIFPMDANRRISNRLELFYSLFGASDVFDTVVSRGGHAYREDIRRSVYRFMNIYLKQDARPVTDSEVDLVTGPRNNRRYPIPPEKLRVFPTDKDIPSDQRNGEIDRLFVPKAELKLPDSGKFAAWKEPVVKELRRVSFGAVLPFPTAQVTRTEGRRILLRTEEGITVPLFRLSTVEAPKRILLVVAYEKPKAGPPAWLHGFFEPNDAVYLLLPRGTGPTRWTTKNPPNYVERSHALLGMTVDTGRVADVAAAVRLLFAWGQGKTPVWVAGRNSAGVIAAYAALLSESVSGVIIKDPPQTHEQAAAPQFLNVLRVCDIPDVLGMLAPRRLILNGGASQVRRRVKALYERAGAAPKLTS